MRIALFQGPEHSGEVDANVARVLGAGAQAAEAGADLLLTAELALTGYNIGADACEARAESADGPAFRMVAARARELGLAIGYGYLERVGDAVFNSVAIVGPDGSRLANHRKVHLFGDLDRGLFRAGDDLVTQFTLGDLTYGVAICYDVEFPELVRAHAECGTDVLLVPTGLMAPFDVVSRILVPARAYESQLVIAYANRCDTEGDMDYCGISCVVGPDGTDLARAGRREELLVVDIDREALAHSRALNTHLGDRRHDLYPPITPAS